MKTKETAKQIFEKGITNKNLTTYINSLKKSDRLEHKKVEGKLRERLSELQENKEKEYQKMIAKKRAAMIGISLKKYYELEEKANKVAECFEAGYSMGGQIIIDLHKSTRSKKYIPNMGMHDTRQYYAKSCDWKETHGYQTIPLNLEQLEKINIIDGIPTMKENGKVKILAEKGEKNNHVVYWETK